MTDAPGQFLLPVDESLPKERLRPSMLLLVGVAVVLIHLLLVTVFTPLKPDPAGALLIARKLGVDPADCLYVGDTSTDMNCGSAAGMETVGVLWGYRPREELTANGARRLISDPMELIDLAEA